MVLALLATLWKLSRPLKEILKRLEQAAIDERFDVKQIVSEIVPTYHIRQEDKERDAAIYEAFCKLGRASHEGPIVEES